jgi:hypothetical protein
MDTYTHIGSCDERTALDSLPELPILNRKENEQHEAAAQKTGTDNLPVETNKNAYKKLTKNAFSHIACLSSVSNTSENEEKNQRKLQVFL